MDFRVIKMCNIINKSKIFLKEIKTIKHSGLKLKQASQALSQTSIYTCRTELCNDLEKHSGANVFLKPVGLEDANDSCKMWHS